MRSDRDRHAYWGARIGVASVLMSWLLVAGLSSTTLMSVTRVFKWIKPRAEYDLRWKTEHGLAELSARADIGALLSDEELIREAVLDYTIDSEVLALEVQNASGAKVFSHRAQAGQNIQLFANRPDEVDVSDEALKTWTYISVEEQQVGRVALAISTDRLRAGGELRDKLVRYALGAAIAGLILSLTFVRLYIAPLLALNRRAFLDLEKKTEEALEAMRVKSEFVANISHELRTPLSGIIGMIGLLIRSKLTPQQRRHAEIAAESSESLLALINEILEFSSLEVGQARLSVAPCNLRHLVQGRMELLAVRGQAKGLEVAYEVASDVPETVQIDETRLGQLMTNLVGNAVKFTAQGNIMVSLYLVSRTPDAVMLRFEVRDTGPGIPRELQGKLFRSFSQVDASSSRGFEGTGLGLAISKHLVELMDGSIGVQSEAGQGAVFWFQLPCQVVEEAKKPEFGSRLRGKRVLLAGSNEMTCALWRRWLLRWNMEVSGCVSSVSCAELAEQARAQGAPFDVVIVDMSMIEGASLAARLQERFGPELSLIKLAPLSWPAEEIRAEGVSYLTKPLRERELLQSLCLGPETESKAGPSLPAAARPVHVLVVDDNEVSRLLSVEILHELSHTFDQAKNGEEAITRAQERDYDLILMDCQMPGISGYEAATTIRNADRERMRHTPIVALTAHASREEEERVRAAGMDALLIKPPSPEGVAKVIEEWTSRFVQKRAELPTLLPRKRSQKLLEVFLRTVPEQVDALRDAAQRGDREGVQWRAHRLRGSAGSIGAENMAVLCERLERGFARIEASSLVALAEELAREFDKLVVLLEEELAKGGSTPQA